MLQFLDELLPEDPREENLLSVGFANEIQEVDDLEDLDDSNNQRRVFSQPTIGQV